MVYNQANTLPASNPSGFSMEGDKANTKPTFWCFLTILPVKMGLKTFCILQFLGDLCFGLINMFVFLLASALLAVSPISLNHEFNHPRVDTRVYSGSI